MSVNVNPTRMELSKLKKKLITAKRGHKLLKDKRDELMRRFLELVKENKKLREEVEEGIASANKKFYLAKAVMKSEYFETALLAPSQALEIEVEEENIMSVEFPSFNFKTKISEGDGIYSYGPGFTSGDLDDAVAYLEKIFPSMLKLAQCEKTCCLMAAEIERTRRRVNALEHIMIPDLEEKIRYITMKLDENERSTQIRLMKVKDMMIEENIRKQKAANC